MMSLLAGMTVVEGAAFVAGPSCALYLAQMGALVIRIDQIGGGPDARRWPLGPQGESLYWQGLNKGKLSIALDYRSAEGRELAQRIATGGEGLFVTNFPVDGFFTHEALQALRADQITLRVMGWPDGSPAVDYTVNAAVGLPLMTGHPDDDRPVNHVLPAWDLLTGAYAAFALLAAERERRASGEGREVRVALSDIAATSLAHLGNVAEVMLSGHDREKTGNNLFGAFGRDFSASDGARFMLVAITPKQWRGMVDALEIADEIIQLERALGVDFAADEGARFTHRDKLDAVIEQGCARFSSSELEARFDRAGVTWSRYRSLHEAVTQDARLVAGNPVFSTVEHAGGAAYPTPGAAAYDPAVPREPAKPAPTIGADTDQILAEHLGLGSGEIARLHDRGIVG